MKNNDQPLSRAFVAVWIGQTVSEVGSMLSAIGAAVYVYLQTGSAVWLGVLSALAAAPAIIAVGFAPVVDRFPRRSVLLVADIVAASGVVVALGLAAAGRLEVWHLAVAGFIGGLGTAVQVSASQAAVTALVEPEQYDRANSLKQMGPAIGIVVGPVLATPLLAWWGIEMILTIDLVTFAVGIGSVLAVRFDDAPPERSVNDDGSWRDMWAWLSGPGRPLLGLMVIGVVLNFSLAFVNIAMLAAATTLAGAARSGLVLGLAGTAMIVGSLVSAAKDASDDRVGRIAMGLAVVGVGFAVAGSRPNAWVLGGGIAIALGAVPAVTATIASIYNERVPPQMQGRVFALRLGLSNVLQPLGSVLAGVAIAHVAGPAVSDGMLTGSIGRVIGVGPSSGPALVLVAAGLVIAAIGLLIARYRPSRGRSLPRLFASVRGRSGEAALGLGLQA